MVAQQVASTLLPLAADADSESVFLSAALGELCRNGGALVRPTPPSWTVLSVAGVAASALPMELAAEALDRGGSASAAGWTALPLRADDKRAEIAGNAIDVLLLRATLDTDSATQLATHLGDALRTVRERFRCERRGRRLEKILDITHEWHQTNEMDVLLNRMAEAATELLNSDRASIFLWDKSNKTLIGRPALGVEGGSLTLADNVGIVGQVVQTGEPRRVNSQSDQAEIDHSVDKKTGYHTETVLCVPLVSPSGERLGAFEVLNKRDGRFTAEDERGLIELSAYASIALQNTQQLETVVARHEQLVEQAAEGVQLVGSCPQIVALQDTLRRVADTDLAILILGENGTGKEVVARSLHYQSTRRSEPFVAVNCAALTETLLESELFGHEKGAFTDAHEARAGKFELASGGTLFLDEIGDMSLGGQAKLLRVLEDKTVVRVGGSAPIHTEVRVLAATNQDLAARVREKKFREDLYFRLNVVSLELPPLRERGDDIVQLAEHFLLHFCQNIGRRRPTFTASAKKRLLAHTWPGNVRELRNLMERLAYLTAGDKIDADDLAFILSPRSAGESGVLDSGESLNDATRAFQAAYIRQTIDRLQGNVSEAAKSLGVHRSNLYRKMRQLGMEAKDDG